MDVVTPKENILRRIREALGAVPMGTARPVDLETPVYPEIKGDEAVVFAENFTAQGGALVYCERFIAQMKRFGPCWKSHR